ncbi:MAG: EamA family transporter [Candidatus Gottesmanbacteria bacterium]|nr:EamA family transporter [Candidatus Gottesmanbacteria bacterium]
MSYIGFAWITAILYSSSFLVGKYSTKHKIANPWLYNFIWSFIIVILSTIIAIFQGAGIPHDWRSLVLAGFLSAIASVTYTLSIYLLDVTVLGPLYNFRTPMAVLLGVLMFGEKLSMNQMMLIGIMTIAGMFISMDERFSIRTFFRKPIAFALLTIAVSALYNASLKYASVQNGYWSTVLWFNIINQVFLVVTVPLFWKELHRVRPTDYIHVSISAVLAGLGGITVIPALLGNLGITAAILSLPIAMVIAIALSVVAPHLLEKHPWKVYAVRLGAAAVMFGSALMLSR